MHIFMIFFINMYLATDYIREREIHIRPMMLTQHTCNCYSRY